MEVLGDDWVGKLEVFQASKDDIYASRYANSIFLNRVELITSEREEIFLKKTRAEYLMEEYGRIISESKNNTLSFSEIILEILVEILEKLETLFKKSEEELIKNSEFILWLMKEAKDKRDLLTVILRVSIPKRLENKYRKIEEKASKLEASVLAKGIKNWTI